MVPWPLYDICLSPVTLSSQQELDDWNGVVHGFLSHGTKTPVHLGALMSANPNFAMGHAARGLFSLMMGRKELCNVAEDAAAAAHAAAAGSDLTTRERGWIAALDSWLSGSLSGAIAEMEAILRDAPDGYDVCQSLSRHPLYSWRW